MRDDWKTPRQPRLIGHMNDAHGRSVAFSVDRDEIIIRRGGQNIRLGAAERDLFMRIFVQAEREIRQPQVVEAEIWCGDPGDCVNGPAAHLSADSCQKLPEDG